jgi:stage II sporulation protein D
MDDRVNLAPSDHASEGIEPEMLVELAMAATETHEVATAPKPSLGQRLKLGRVKQLPKATGRWIYGRPWLALPLLAIFPVAAWQIDRRRPVEPVAIEQPRQTTPTTIGNLMQPAPLGQVTVGSPAGHPLPNPTASPTPTAAGSPKPVDLNTLTPEQKAMNAKAKAALMGAAALVDAQIEMQVGIATKASAIAVGGASAVEVTDKDGKVLYQLAANEIYTAQPSAQGVSIGDQNLPNNVFLNAPQTGVIIVGGRAYRGRLRIVNDAGVLYGVSHVNMRNYLQSVVASEVSPTWGKEALKAQAVAARSYALTYYFKPASKHFHLGNDEYYQVYSGIEREAAETNQAVDETSGEYVSYKGGIVESLYAASDDIVAEAFAGKGMSQLGAKSLANQGYKYEQILAGYYPKTSVGKILPDL